MRKLRDASSHARKQDSASCCAARTCARAAFSSSTPFSFSLRTVSRSDTACASAVRSSVSTFWS
eukprot:2555518-Alexandrium_andersonii.AAC.1